jgi:hypothetical protein
MADTWSVYEGFAYHQCSDVDRSMRKNGSSHTPRTQSQVRKIEPGTSRRPCDAEDGKKTDAVGTLADVGGGISFKSVEGRQDVPQAKQ